MLGQLVDRIAAMQQDALVTIDEGDVGLAGGGRGEAGVVGEFEPSVRGSCRQIRVLPMNWSSKAPFEMRPSREPAKPPVEGKSDGRRLVLSHFEKRAKFT
jgi:hypothetical protein